MGYIPPTNAAEKAFVSSLPLLTFTQETASTANLAPDSIDAKSTAGSQVIKSIYDGESLLASIASMAAANPSMSSWAAQEESVIGSQIAHEYGLLITGTATPGTYKEPVPVQGSSTDAIDAMLNLLQFSATPSNINTATTSVIAAIEQAEPGDTLLAQIGSSFQAALSAELSDPSAANAQALRSMESAFVGRLQSDGIGTAHFAPGGNATFEASIENLTDLASNK